MQKEIEEEWKHEMMEQHVKLRLGHYDKFEDFLKLARSIKSPFTRDYTYESSYANKAETSTCKAENRAGHFISGLYPALMYEGDKYLFVTKSTRFTPKFSW
eukprot:scaffold84133_cov61-Attheya_sp.AAC.3